MGFPDVIHPKDMMRQIKATDIDTALQLCKHRWFHWKLLLISGFGFLATGFEFTLHAYILPFAECDLKINAADMGVINALFLGGSLVSSLFWGVMADAKGRKKVLVVAAISEGIGTVIVSWSGNFIMFTIVRTICGFLCGGAATVLLSYVGEFCSDKMRPRNICLLGFAWTLSWMILPGIATLIFQLNFELDTGFVTYKPWRLFVALVGLPNILSGLFIAFFLPESPKYFFAKGDEKRALEILQNMYSLNSGEPARNYPVTRLHTGIPEVDNYSLASKVTKKASISSLVSTMLSQMKILFCPPLLWSTILSCSIYVCGMFGYYGLGLWLPTLFDRFEEFYKLNPNVSASVCDLSRADQDVSNSTIVCQEREISIAVFTNTFILGAGCFIGNLLATYLATKIPVRILSSIFFAVGGICGLVIYFINSSAAIVAVSTCFMAAVNAGISVHNVGAINLFPTARRGMGVCISFLFGRLSAVLSSLVFGLLIDINCSIPIFLVATIVLVGAGFCLLMPKASQIAKE